MNFEHRWISRPVKFAGALAGVALVAAGCTPLPIPKPLPTIEPCANRLSTDSKHAISSNRNAHDVFNQLSLDGETSRPAAAAITAAAYYETRVDPKFNQNHFVSMFNISASNGGVHLQQYAVKHHKSTTELSVQTGFIMNEIQTSDNARLRALPSEDDVCQASQIFDETYLRPAVLPRTLEEAMAVFIDDTF